MADIRLLADPQGTADNWTQIAVITNGLKDPRYGNFAITEQQVEGWKRSLTAGYVTGEPNRVATDYEHAMDDPRSTPKDREASGWITDLKTEGKRVLAKIDWTPEAKTAIESGKFRYFSPTYRDKYKLQDGAEVADVLMGGALTNRPFLRKGMQAVTLAQLEADTEFEPADPPATPPVEPRAIVRAVSDFTKILGQALGLGAEATEESIAAKVADLAKPDVKALAQEQGLVILSQDQHDTLVTSATDAVKELKETRFENAFTKALSQGRVAPVEKDDLKEAFDLNEELAIKMLANRPANSVAQTAPRGVAGDTATEATQADVERYGDGGVHNVDGGMLRFTLACEQLVSDGKAKDIEEAGILLSQTAEYAEVLA